MSQRALAVISALALLWAFVWAPFAHVHRPDSIRHAHLIPHDDGHHHHGTALRAADDEHGGEMIGVAGFLSAGPNSVGPLVLECGSTAVVFSLIRSTDQLGVPEPAAHSPPSHDRLIPRAPPALFL